MGISYSEVFEKARLNAIDFAKRPTGDPVELGDSKIGGRPHLPPSIEWPYYEGRPQFTRSGELNLKGKKENRPMAFLAQINLAQATMFDDDERLPKTGWLYFFYELKSARSVWGAEDIGCSRVFYYNGDIGTLAEREFPSDLKPTYQLAESTVVFRARQELPSSEELRDILGTDLFPLSDRYDRISANISHKLIGDRLPPPRGYAHEAAFFPNRARKKTYPLWCKLLGFSDGYGTAHYGVLDYVLNGGEAGTLTTKEVTEKCVSQSSSEWRLLCQIGGKIAPRTEVSGLLLHFYIRQSDLVQARFDRVQMMTGCILDDEEGDLPDWWYR